MEYINIISKEAVTAVPGWCFLVTLLISFAIALVGFIISKNDSFNMTPLLISCLCAIVFEGVLLILFLGFYSIPTGRYEYAATVDKDKITVTEYEEFITKYNPDIRDGIYYFTAEEIAQ